MSASARIDEGVQARRHLGRELRALERTALVGDRESVGASMIA